MDDATGWFSRSTWKLSASTFCCYNAFSNVDLRVEVSIPGGVKSYVIDGTGQRSAATPEIWTGAFVSSVLRSIHNHQSDMLGLRKIELFSSMSLEKKFLDAAKAMFNQGWKCGAEPVHQMSSNYNNYLTDGLVKYGKYFQRNEVCFSFFDEVSEPDTKLHAIRAHCYLEGDEEVKVVQLLHKYLSNGSMCSAMLHIQSKFLERKGEMGKAIEAAKWTVKFSPSDFISWSNLCHLHIERKEYEEALNTLNSCVMLVFHENENFTFPKPVRVKIPRRKTDNPTKPDNVDVMLQNLPAENLKGTFSVAYSLLAKINDKIGWDDLLFLRSEVFVMEEEYREHVIEEKTRSEATLSLKYDSNGNVSEVSPLVKHSTKPSLSKNEIGHQKIPSVDARSLRTGAITRPLPTPISPTKDMSQKRLCERWLDNLFMILYEDLRVYTIWKAEQQYMEAQDVEYQRNSTEWEILGNLSLRLCKVEDAKEAFRKAVEKRFSEASWIHLLEIYCKEDRVSHAINAASKLITHYESKFQDLIFPNDVSIALFGLIKKHGMSKIRGTVVSMNFPQNINFLYKKYFNYAENFQICGYDY